MTAQPARGASAIIVSSDPARAAVLATGFSDARLLSPDAAAELGPARDGNEVLVFPAGATGAAVVDTLRRQRPDATQILVEVGTAEPVMLRGLEFTEVVEIAGVEFWSLRTGPNDDVVPDLPAVDGTSKSGQSETARHIAELDALRREVRRLETELAERAAPADALPAPGPLPAEADASQSGPPRPPTTTRRPSVGRRRVALAVLTVLAVIGVLISAGVAAVTGTGYLGGVLTLLTFVVGGGFLTLAMLLRRTERAAARRHRATARTVSRQRRLAQRDARHRIERLRVDAQRQLRSVSARQREEGERGDRLKSQLDVIAATVVETARRPGGAASRSIGPHTDPTTLTQMHQTQALMNLFALGPVRGILPPMGGWAASPDVVAVLVEEMLTRRPQLVVECGGGVSTLWLALVADWYQLPTRIVALDHDAHFAEQTRRTLTEHNVAHRAEVRHAPLGPVDLAGHATPWYDRSTVADLQDIGLLFVDGPPDTIGPLVRWPAVPVLHDQLAPRAAIILDDLNRPSEQEVTARWSVVLPDFVLERLPLQKGAARFRR